MPTRRFGSSCSSWNAAPKARLVARSIAFTFGRSKVTSMTWPRFSTRTELLMVLLPAVHGRTGLYHGAVLLVDRFRRALWIERRWWSLAMPQSDAGPCFRRDEPGEGGPMQITKIYADRTGETHFRACRISLIPRDFVQGILRITPTDQAGI